MRGFATPQKNMKTALFFNFTDKSFTGFWDGKPKTFAPGQREYMPEYLAKHFAKHLTNKVLLEKGGVNENYTSPKFPEQVPQFMDIFKKACIVSEGPELDQAQLETELANKPRSGIPAEVARNAPQEIPPVEGDDEDDEDENFEGLKKEKNG